MGKDREKPKPSLVPDTLVASDDMEVGGELTFLNKLSELIDTPRIEELSKELQVAVQDFHQRVEEIGAKFGVGLSDNVSFQIHG